MIACIDNVWGPFTRHLLTSAPLIGPSLPE